MSDTNLNLNLFAYDDHRLGTPQVGRFLDTGTSESSVGRINIRKAESQDKRSPNDTVFCDTCIISSIQYNREVAFQPEPTLSGDLYINFFGDKPTQYTVEGVAFDRRKCKAVDPLLPGKGENPVKSIIDFYDKYRLKLSKNQTAEDQVTLTTYDTLYDDVTVTYVGILVAMKMNLIRNQENRLQYDFSFTFLAIE